MAKTKARKKTANKVITESLVPEERRAAFQARVAELAAHNQMLAAIEEGRQILDISKKELAELAGLNASSVRRMLTSETANPTTNNAFRLFTVLGIKLEATLPSGDRVGIV
jgi:ribosome-binding protein aMBF1 (putative translation factor)